MTPQDPRFVTWCAALEARHLGSLTFQEVRRSFAALSSRYTARKVGQGKQPAAGRGIQAAFALGYAPLHLLMVAHVIEQLSSSGHLQAHPEKIYDLGCGTGVGGAAWSLADKDAPRPKSLVVGCDIDPWALAEARWNWQTLGISGQTLKRPLQDVSVPLARNQAIILAYAANELPEAAQSAVLKKLVAAQAQGCQVLVVEPIARGITPFWPAWEAAFIGAGGRADTWRLGVQLPSRLALLGRAAGLDHRELTARTLSM